MTSVDEDFGSHRLRGDGRRGPAHAKTSPRWPDAGVGPYQAQGAFPTAPPQAGGDPRFTHQDGRWPDAGPPAYQDAGPAAYQSGGPPAYQAGYYQSEYPGWTEKPAYQANYPDYGQWGGQAGYQAEQPEYPEWRERPAYRAEYPEYPGWAGAGQQVEYPEHAGWAGQQQSEYPGHYGQYALHPDHPSWPEAHIAPWPGAEGPLTDHRPSGVAMAPPLPERVRPPFTPEPGFPPRADVPPHLAAPRREIPLHRDMDFHPAPVMQDTITDVANWGRTDVAFEQPAREQMWDAGSSQLANWIIEDANEQAAEITRQARNQASSSLVEAHKEAAELVRRTGEQAALTLEAAELEAAEIRATMMRLTTDLTGMAAYVTQNLTGAPPLPAAPPAAAPLASAPLASAPSATARPAADRAAALVTTPAAQPAPGPGAPSPAGPAASPADRPTAGPGARAARQPGAASAAARPTAKSNGKSRQHAAVRVMTIFTAAMVVLALTAGASEVALHGFKFFVFRSTGTGETGPNGGQEDQGPGQPDAPVVHQQLQKP